MTRPDGADQGAPASSARTTTSADSTTTTSSTTSSTTRTASTSTSRPRTPGGGPIAGPRDRGNRLFLAVGLLVAFILAGFVSGYASSSPDGLEKIAEDKGFIQQADDHSFADWPLADYAVSGIGDERLAGGVAGIIGVSIAYVVGAAVVLGVTRLRTRSRATAPTGEPVAESSGSASRP